GRVQVGPAQAAGGLAVRRPVRHRENRPTVGCRAEGGHGPVRYNLGCGLDILPGWVNVDGAEVLRDRGVEVWDLEEMPWPFPGASADEIRAIDVFEHIEPKLRVGFITECHRMLKPGATLRMQTAYYTSIDAYTDPTHYGAFTEHSFDFWIPGTLH